MITKKRENYNLGFGYSLAENKKDTSNTWIKVMIWLDTKTFSFNLGLIYNSISFSYSDGHPTWTSVDFECPASKTRPSKTEPSINMCLVNKWKS